MIKKIKTLSILCTRPSAIKMAPVVRTLQKHDAFENRICVTGQHRDMLDPVLRLFQIKSDYDLNIMTPNQDLYSITTRVLEGLKSVFRDVRPDYVIVQGDTTSMMTAALAAFYEKITVAHVEAGLRTHHIYAPFPEEINRVMTTRIAQIHFAPTESAKLNLLKENIPEKNITVTGNTVIDALLWVRDQVNQRVDWSHVIGHDIQSLIDQQKNIILITGHRRENFGEGFNNIFNAFKILSQQYPEWHFVYPVHLNPQVQKPVKEILSHLPNFHLIKPLEYAPFVYLMDKATIIVTDSGGVQEEAPSLGKPVLVTRDITERMEGVEAGVVILVGTNTEKIIRETEALMQDAKRRATMSRIQNPYGDGKSAQRIVESLLKRAK